MCFVHIVNVRKKKFDLQNWQNNFRFTHKLIKKLPLKFSLIEEIMDLFQILLTLMHLHFREIHIVERFFQRLPKIRLKEFLIKTQVHENKNAASEMIYSHCGPCLLLSASLPSSAWKKAS